LLVDGDTKFKFSTAALPAEKVDKGERIAYTARIQAPAPERGKLAERALFRNVFQGDHVMAAQVFEN
jgi:hypothetical protein